VGIKTATKEDLYRIIELERAFFSSEGYRPELPVAYEMILELGVVWYKDDEPEGMLATVPVSSIMSHSDRVLSLPVESHFRERYRRGYLDGYEDRTFICAFIAQRNLPSLVRKFRELPKAVGFVNESDKKALDFYKRFSCRIVGMVENIHSPGKLDYVLTYDRSPM